MTTASSDLDLVFGAETRGATANERARASRRWFVRSQAQLAPHRPGMTGLTITARAALDLVGFEKLLESVEKGAVVVNPTLDEPARTIREQREAMELTVADVSRAAGVAEKSVAQAETRGAVTPIRDLLRLAQMLGLNDDLLSAEPQAQADRELAVRLRTLRRDRNAQLSASLVLKLSEAAWVISKQLRTAQLLGIDEDRKPEGISPDDSYGPPPWRKGFELAERTRELLGLDPLAPITSVRQVIEQLGIPLVQAELGQTFAGATLQNGQDRGIVVNVEGDNGKVWVRRMTLCHELGHLLWDPSRRLQHLHVDRYRDLNETSMEPVEARANGFAIAFLAPREAVLEIIRKKSTVAEKVAEIMSTFGIAATAAKYHLANVAAYWGQQLDTTRVPTKLLPAPDEGWETEENWTVDFFPVQGVPVSRRGRFAGLVALAAKRELISLDQAAVSLMVPPEQFEKQLDVLIDVCAHDLSAAIAI